MFLGVGRTGNFSNFSPENSQEGGFCHAVGHAVSTSPVVLPADGGRKRVGAPASVSNRDTNRKLLNFYRRKFIGK